MRLFPTDSAPRTHEWRSEEYLLIDGQECTYDVIAGRVMVHFPGGRARSLDDLRAAQHSITLPVRWHGERVG